MVSLFPIQSTRRFLAVIADLTCQTVIAKNDQDKPILERISWKRTFNFALISTCFFPPLAHYWYGWLSVKIVGDNLLAAMKRVFLDQVLFAPVCLSGFFSLNLLLDGKIHHIQEKLKNDLLPTMSANYAVWIPAQVINFMFVPIPLRVLWANMVGFFWNIYLSNAANTTHKK
eukprot:gene4553-4992_t